MSGTKNAVIILNWNCYEDAIKCLDSLKNQTVDLISVVVDNNSSDNSVAELKKYQSENESQVVLLENSQNSGFSGGINFGLKWVMDNDFQNVGLLNPDATADEKWAEYLIEALKNEEVGISTGLMLRQDGKTIDTSGDFYTTWCLPGPRNRDEKTEKAPKKSEFIFGATGGGVFYKTKMLKEVGFFDEDFFMYYEDVDISFRSQLMGWKTFYESKAIAYHKVGASSGKVPGLAIFNTFKNLPYVFIKNMPGKLFFKLFPNFVLMYTLLLASSIKNGAGKYAFKGMLTSLIKTPKTIQKRLKIQKNIKVSEEYISSIIHKGPLPNQTGLIKFRKIFIKK